MMNTEFKLTKGNFKLDLKLALPNTGVTVIFGESGCGKTTFLRCIAGLETEVSGLCIVNDKVWMSDTINLPPHKRSTGYVFQDANLFNHLNVYQNITYGMKRFNTSSDVTRDNAIDILGISSLLNRYPDTLSGGEKQRVAIARAVAINPEVLLMDEPLSGLDHKRKSEILPYLKRLKADLSIPIIYVTHSTDELIQIADQVICIEKGTCIDQVTISDDQMITSLPIKLKDEWKKIIETRVIQIDSQWHLAKVLFGDVSLWIQNNDFRIGHKVRLSISSQQISIALEKNHSSFQNVLPGTVIEIKDDKHPSSCLLNVKIGIQIFSVNITKRALKKMQIKEQSHVYIQIKSVAIEQ